MQAWQEKASAQDFVLQMVMERIFYRASKREQWGALSGQTILWMARLVADPWCEALAVADTLPSPMPTDTLDNLLRKLCRIDPARASRGRD